MNHQQKTLTGFLKPKHEILSNCGDSFIMEDDDPDISITKIVKPKKIPVKWVTSTFEDFGSDISMSQPKSQTKSFSSNQSSSMSQSSSSTQPVNRKRPRNENLLHRHTTSHKQSSKFKASNMDLWAERHHPVVKADLAVHKKKIEEVEIWINKRISEKKASKVLLLTGPSGAGKTATIQLLCKELNLQLQEWSNPINQSNLHFDTNSHDYWEQSRVDVGVSGSQQSQFENFLLRANKYQCLQLDGGGCNYNKRGKIILIEELPNIYLRDASLFHNVLRRYHRVGQSPLVFIISDSSRGDSKERLLFPPDIQQELYIQSISFNPVAPTMMVKVLNRVASLEKTESTGSPSSTVIESIAMSSSGDIRSAINALQFACRQDTFDLNITCKSQKQKKTGKGTGSRLKYECSKPQKPIKSTGDELAGIGARDTSCFLFHAVGKILYCKRGDPTTYESLPKLPSHLSHQERDPMLINPEDVVEKSQVSGDYFSSFLHHNYVDFYTNIEDVVNASEYISLVDTFSSKWSTKAALQNYATSIASRGIIHSNTTNARFNAPKSGVGWKPLHKSQWFTVQKQAKRNLDVACSLFRGYHWDPEVLWTEILPNLNIINVTLRNPAQITFIQEMSRFCKRAIQNKGEKLDENEVVLDESDVAYLPVNVTFYSDQSGDFISSSQSEVKNSQLNEEDEELEIDEFSDSD